MHCLLLLLFLFGCAEQSKPVVIQTVTEKEIVVEKPIIKLAPVKKKIIKEDLEKIDEKLQKLKAIEKHTPPT